MFYTNADVEECIKSLECKIGELDAKIKSLQDHATGEHVNLGCKLLSNTAILPTKTHAEDAGWDLYSCEDVVLEYGKPTLIKTNVAFDFPPYYHAFVWDRSSMGKKGIKVCGGMIDNGYRGSVDVVLLYGNFSEFSLEQDTDYDGQDRPVLGRPYCYKPKIKINKCDKIAQLVLVKMPMSYLHQKDELSVSSRGEKGWGSSGV